MTINIGGGELKELKPRILVLGVGGAGGNAINAMIESGMEGRICCCEHRCARFKDE